MKKSFLAGPALLLFLRAVTASTAIAYPDSSLQAVFHQIQDNLLNDRFADAARLSQNLIERFPDDPSGYSFLTAALMSEMIDAEENLHGPRFVKLTDSVVAMCHRQLESGDHQQAGWLYLWSGNALAYRALYESRFGSFFSAVKKGMNARSEYQAGLDLDSSNCDLLLGLGSYHYWKSVKAGVLRWLMVFSNEKDKGLAEITKAVDSAVVFSEAARSALIWVWLNEEQYDSVITGAQLVHQRYPSGKVVLWPLAQAYYETRQFDKAITVYETLRQRFESDPGNYFNLIECDRHLVSIFLENGDNDSAVASAARVNEYYENVPPAVRKRQKSKLAFLKRYAR